MEQIRNRFSLPVQAGEFICIENGECHILDYTEEWQDAPEDSSGYRGVFLYGLYIGKFELRARIINDRGFAELDSEYKQSIAEEPITQEVFDLWIDSNDPSLQFKPVTVRQFCEQVMFANDGCYFVKFARGCLYQHEISQIEKEWCEFKIREKLPKPDAGTASKWIDEWLSTHPELDAPWIVDEMVTQISLIEEPGERDDTDHPFVGKKVFIREMKGEPEYTGKTGTVTSVDDAGQIHGTWGGCALTVEDDYDFVEEDKVDEDHYNDGSVDVRVISEFCLTVFTNTNGDTVTVNFDSNFFSPSDLVAAYKKSLEALNPEPEEKESLIANYRSYLISCGCEKEEVTDNE